MSWALPGRLRWAALLLAALPPALLLAAPGAELVRLELGSDQITAADLARVSPPWGEVDPALVVGHAPLPGVERRVDRRQLARWARQAGLDLEAERLPAALLVSRRMRALPSHEAANTLQALIAEQYELDPGAVAVELGAVSEILVPAGELSFRLAAPPRKLNQPVPLTLRWEDSDGRTGSVPLLATSRIVGSYLVAREDLPPRTQLSPADFVVQQGPLPDLPDKYLMHLDDVNGMALRNHIKSGELLEKRLLVIQPTVRRGDLLELQLRSGSIVLRAPGRAEQSGSAGDPIKCRNLQSNLAVTAIIVDRRHAEVSY